MVGGVGASWFPSLRDPAAVCSRPPGLPPCRGVAVHVCRASGQTHVCLLPLVPPVRTLPSLPAVQRIVGSGPRIVAVRYRAARHMVMNWSAKIA